MNAREKQSEAEPFKVGDRVKVADAPYFLRGEEKIGSVLETGIADGRRGSILVVLDNYDGDPLTFLPHELVKKAKAPALVVYDSPEYARSLEKEIVRLTTEAAKLKREKEFIRNAHNAYATACRGEHASLLDARKKLEDIAAIERVNRLVSALHGTDLKQDWTFHGLIIAVTEGKVAA